MKQEIDNNLLADCFESAMREKFLEKDWEIKLWAYSCIMRICGGGV